MWALFCPEILEAGAVKGLITVLSAENLALSQALVLRSKFIKG